MATPADFLPYLSLLISASIPQVHAGVWLKLQLHLLGKVHQVARLDGHLTVTAEPDLLCQAQDLNTGGTLTRVLNTPA